MAATAYVTDPNSPADLALAAPRPGGRDRLHLELVRDSARVPGSPAEALGVRGVGSLGPDPMVEVYRRRRFLALLVVTILVVVGSQFAGVSLTSFGPITSSDDQTSPIVHVVRPGDTYQKIAASLGASDPISFGDQLRANNGQAELAVGQRLMISRSSAAPWISSDGAGSA